MTPTRGPAAQPPPVRANRRGRRLEVDRGVSAAGILRVFLVLAFALGGAGDLRAGSILREVWQDIAGNAISDLTSSPNFPNQPSATNLVTDLFEGPVDAMDQYGQRIHGFIIPPVTGDYTFWIASDDNGELWLSTDQNPVNKKLIATVSSWTNSREWERESNQESSPVRLQAGRSYYIAALQKDGSGGDNLAVRWLRPDGIDEGPIPATYLLPFGIATTPPVITEQPSNTTVPEGEYAVFQVKVSNVDPVAYFWQLDGTPLPGETAAILRYGPVTMFDNGARFSAVLTNNLGSTNTATATLTVLPDQVRPTLTNAINLGIATVRIIYSEPVATASALNPANYSIDPSIAITGIAFGPDAATVLLTTSPLTYGTHYTVTVNGVRDLASAPNAILPDSHISFTAYEYAPADVGSPALNGSTVIVPGGYDVTGAGKDIGGTSDQFQFGWQERTGDFDMQVRVARVTVSDPYLHAGLMARENLDGNARFAAIFASSAQLGCFFEARSSAGTATETAAPSGGFRVNYPQTWLRLRRSGQTLTGFASVDGQTWVQLGSRVFSGLPAKLYFGLAVTSDNAARSATAQFRDLGPTISKTVGPYTPTSEPLGPSSRTTGIILSEIMYHPAARSDERNLEFIEIHNARSIFEDLTGWRISGEVDFRFPDGFTLESGEFVVVAAAPEDIRAVYGITNVLGPFTGVLPNDGGTLRLRNNADAIRLEIDYSGDPPGPAAADGAGPSLVLARPSYGENHVKAWAASEWIGGSPGELDAVYPAPQRAVVINEFLAHTDDPVLDYVELYNPSNAAIDLAGCVITDDPATNRFRVPPGTSIPARGFLAFDQQQLGFALSSAGETLYLFSADATRVLDAIRFGGQENGVASGRSPDGSPTVRRLAAPTPGVPNAPWRVEDIVINEIMYNPISLDDDDEYVELHNRGSQAVDLGGWRFCAGIDYVFPPGASVAAGGHVVVAKNAAQLISHYSQLSAANTFGDYQGALRNSGEHLALAKPDQVLSTNTVGEVETNWIEIVVSEVAYEDGGRWGQWSDAGGSSLELIDPRADLLRAANWADSDETQKAPWTEVSFTGKLDNGQTASTPNRFHILMQGAGECLVDDVEIFRVGSTNLLSNGGFEGGATTWNFFGNHSRSGIISAGAASGSSCLQVRGQGNGDTGVNSIRAPLATGLASGNTATIKAKVRWLAGWPEVLFRTRGNWIELPARLSVPRNLGTPGLPNSRRVANAGPALYDVNHNPALPRANESVIVTCRVSDPDGIASVNLQYRLDPSFSLSTVAMRDEGTQGDAVAGDGVFSATLSGRSSGNLVAFRIQATDRTAQPAVTVFPAGAPAQECLIRWEDTWPFGTFAHYHLWSTAATESARGNALNNTYRDATLVYNHYRVIYNVGFRDKGSPYHSGAGDYAVTVPADDLLLGTQDRIFACTGNGGSEQTGLRGQVSAWFGQQLGIPYLHSHYLRLFRNGGQHQNISEDLEQPGNTYAERWFPEDGEGDLYKVAVWFEFQDNNLSFQATGATLQNFLSEGALKLARYRWNWQRRPNDGTANNLTNIFDLVNAANDNTTNYVSRVLTLADIEQWMRVHAFNRILGNWDAWTYNVGQNMFAYKQPGVRWHLMPWDIDFVLGIGDGANAALWGGQDSVANRMYNDFTFRRMLWRAYQDAIAGPMLPERYAPQIDARRAILLKNKVTGLSSPGGINTYINSRRSYINNQLKANDAAAFAITSNGGNGFVSPSPTVALESTAPFAVAEVEVNGIPYPVTWINYTAFRVLVPLTQITNRLTLAGKDRNGNPILGVTDTITVTYTGTVPLPQDHVVLNEIHYNPLETDASFLELYNRSATTPFDLSGYSLKGIGYTFREGAVIQPNAYLVLAKSRAGFNKAFGATIPVFDEFPGSLSNGGEHIELVRPGPSPAEDLRISDVHYDNRLPWPTNAAGRGSSLQLMDPLQDEYRVGNWTALPTDDLNRVTPGRANPTRQNLQAFPLIWLNEVQPNNLTGPLDNAGDREPWIELYNSGPDSIDLSTYYLTDDYRDLMKWRFPASAYLGPKQFLMIWADGEPQESATGALHAGFRLSPTNGSVAIVRLQGLTPTPAVMDYLDYVRLLPDRSFGCYPDGEPRQRRSFTLATPRAANNPAWPNTQVVINEFMAGNTRTLIDPADGQYDDWIELYNAGTNAVDLHQFSLTDNLANTNKFLIPQGTVLQPGAFLLVWADEETGQQIADGDLHADFKLAQDGEQIGLFTPDGVLVDGFEYGPQTNDVSQGRFPDGADLPLLAMETPTPREPNLIAGANKPPVINPIASQFVAELALLAFTVGATDPDPGQTLTFSLGPDAPAGAAIDPASGRFTWTPAETDGPGANIIAVRVQDNGTPSRIATQRVTVTVSEVNQEPSLPLVPNQSIDEGTLFSLSLGATDPDVPPNTLTYTLEPGAPQGAIVDPTSGVFTWTPSEAQGGITHTIGVRVTDDGHPALSASRSFEVVVNKVNNRPDFDFIQPQTANELSQWVLTLAAVDSDDPPSSIRYSFDLAPAGATINVTLGVITWTPSEEQGPTNAIFVVRATETVSPNLSSSQTFSVDVKEINQPPVLAPLANQTVSEGHRLVITNTAYDSDLPAQRLVFSLDPGAPAGASIDADTGVLTWITGPDAGPGAHTLSVRVTDDGPGALSDVQSFQVIVQTQPHVVINEIMYRPAVTNAEFVELYNNSTRTTVDLGGVQLNGTAMQFGFPSGARLSPGQYVLVVRNRSGFAAAYTNAATIAGEYAGQLNRTNDCLRLVKPGPAPGTEVVWDEVHYQSATPWPTAANGQGGSLQLIDPLQDNSRVGNWTAISGQVAAQPRTLISMTNSWRYHQSGADLGTPWREPAFNDQSWPRGAALFYKEEAALPAPGLTPLILGPTTFYFRTHFAFIGSPTGVALKLSSVLDDGAVYYLNGREIYRLGIDPDVQISFDTFTSRTVSDAALEGPFELPATGLREGDNVLAVEVHQINATSSDVVFGMSLVAEGSLAPYTPGYANSVAATVLPFPPIWLNEILPSNTTGAIDNAGDRDPWIELCNTGLEPGPLGDYYLTDDFADLTRWTFPTGAVAEAGTFRLVWADGESSETTGADWHANFRLSAPSGWVALTRIQNGLPVVVDYVDYTDLGADRSYGCLADGQPNSRAILDPPTPAASNQVLPIPVITGVFLTSQSLPGFTWTSSPGRTYRVEATDQVESPDWNNLGEIVATANETSFVDHSSAGSAQRFYRIILIP